METKNFCQSCSMPLDNPEMSGSEKDGSQNKEYCKYCYQNGEFVNPKMTLAEMKIDSGIINMAVSTLPNLKRWKTNQLAFYI